MKRILSFCLVVLLAGGIFIIAKAPEKTFGKLVDAYLSFHGIRKVQTDRFGGQFSYYDGGPKDAPMVMLIHGVGGGPATSWFRLAPVLAEKYRVIIPEMVFAGMADISGIWYTTEIEEDRIAVLANDVGAKRFSIVGLSIGAWVAANYALQNPKRVNRLVLVSPSGIGMDALLEKLTQKRENTGLWFYDNLFYSPPPIPRAFLKSQMARVDALGHGSMDSLQTMIRKSRPLEGRLQKLAVPALLVSGAQDIITPPETAKAMQAQMPNAKLHILDRCAHAVVWDKADALEKLVVDFLKAKTE